MAAASTELVFVNFYADWCHFSNMLSPVWDKAADLVTEKLGSERVVLGKVDCDQQGESASAGIVSGNHSSGRRDLYHSLSHSDQLYKK